MLGKIFRVFDVNSDGTITQKEMQRLVADLFGLIQIQHKDLNQANLAEKAFNEMDVNKDGKVSKICFFGTKVNLVSETGV